MKIKIAICTLILMFSAFAGSVFGGTEGTDSTFYGLGAGNGNFSYYNTFIGVKAGQTNNGGHFNTYVGAAAGRDNTSGVYNTIVGGEAGLRFTGSYNTMIGFETGVNNTSGSGNVFLGFQAGAQESGSNKLYIANSGDGEGIPLIYGEFDNKVVTVNGSLGIGTKTPVRYLHLSGSNAVFRMDRSANTAAFQMVRTDGSGNPMKVFVVGVNASGTNDGEFIINDNGTALSGPGNRRMTIANDGSVIFTGSVTSPTYYTSSSLTLKDNVRTYENALDTVNRLRGVSFDWKDSGKPSVGLIAEEVEKVVPEVVAYNNGAAAGVNYASLVGVLVEAVKEQQAQHKAEIDSLKAEVQDKNSRLEQLEQRLIALEGK
jgi:hypothetical protein